VSAGGELARSAGELPEAATRVQRQARQLAPSRASHPLAEAPVTPESLLAVQRYAGNRAANQLINAQRLPADAQRFATRHELVLGTQADDAQVGRRPGGGGSSSVRPAITPDAVDRFVRDRTKDKQLRAGLLKAWNKNNDLLALDVPRDLRDLVAPPKPDSSGADRRRASRGRKRARDAMDVHGQPVMDVGGYDSGNEKRMKRNKLEKLRAEVSDNEAPEFDAEEYRRAPRVAILLDTGYTALKYFGQRNFITGPGRGKSSAYPNLIPTVSAAVGGDAKLAALLETGLMNMPEFAQAISGIPSVVKNQVQFVLVLMINEIVGRSTSNLIEIVATLQKTKRQAKTQPSDDELLRRMLERCLFAPKGGQKLSRIGHGELSEKLQGSLQKVLARNEALYYSLGNNLGARSHEDMLAKFDVLYKQFEDNFFSHVTFWYEGEPEPRRW
jgi:hypothetical protein